MVIVKLIFFIAFCMFLQIHGTDAHAAENKEYIGIPAAYNILELDHYILAETDGTPVVYLNINEADAKVGACLKNAKSKQQVRVIIAQTPDGTVKPVSCKPIKNSKDCPRKKVGMKTMDGIYQGTDCGDYCYVLLKLTDGREYSAYADSDEVEKLLGTKKGKFVQINVNVEQFWMPDGDDFDGPGFCVVGETFVNGKVIDTKRN